MKARHYENLHIQYVYIFFLFYFFNFHFYSFYLFIYLFIYCCKNEHFCLKIFDSFNIFAKNIDWGYTLELPHRCGSNEYPQSMFWIRNMYTKYRLHAVDNF